jgi:hypothetical protein
MQSGQQPRSIVMKTANLTSTLALAALFALGAGRAMASDPTDTVINGKVVNSTYTFTNITDSGTTATLNQTTIPNLTDGVPFTSLQLVLTGINYTDTQDTFVGNGSAPTITLDLTPTLQMMNGGNYGAQQVTLVGSVIPNGQDATNVAFSLQSPVVFPLVGEMNPQNLDEGSGTFQESLTNLEPNPNSLTLGGATTQNGQPIQANDQDFLYSGTLEIIYAAPEPNSGWLALVAGLGFAGVMLRRRKSA